MGRPRQDERRRNRAGSSYPRVILNPPEPEGLRSFPLQAASIWFAFVGTCLISHGHLGMHYNAVSALSSSSVLNQARITLQKVKSFAQFSVTTSVFSCSPSETCLMFHFQLPSLLFCSIAMVIVTCLRYRGYLRRTKWNLIISNLTPCNFFSSNIGLLWSCKLELSNWSMLSSYPLWVVIFIRFIFIILDSSISYELWLKLYELISLITKALFSLWVSESGESVALGDSKELSWTQFHDILDWTLVTNASSVFIDPCSPLVTSWPLGGYSKWFSFGTVGISSVSQGHEAVNLYFNLQQGERESPRVNVTYVRVDLTSSDRIDYDKVKSERGFRRRGKETLVNRTNEVPRVFSPSRGLTVHTSCGAIKRCSFLLESSNMHTSSSRIKACSRGTEASCYLSMFFNAMSSDLISLAWTCSSPLSCTSERKRSNFSIYESRNAVTCTSLRKVLSGGIKRECKCKKNSWSDELSVGQYWIPSCVWNQVTDFGTESENCREFEVNV